MTKLISFYFFYKVSFTCTHIINQLKTRLYKKIYLYFLIGAILLMAYFFSKNHYEISRFSEIKTLIDPFEIRDLKSRDLSEISCFSEIKNPLDQFEIRDLISLNVPLLENLHISLTNIGAYLLVSLVLILNLSLLSTNNNKVVSNKSSMWQESLYDTIHSIVINQINAKKGEIFFPFIYSLFIFVLINNLISMIPYSFASTSHFILTFSISFTIVLGATLLGFNKHGLEFFSLFVPAGCPAGLLPILVLIEFISYLTRNISLGLRLAANIFSGHMLLNILSGFTFNIMKSGFFFFLLALFPLTFIIGFSGLELGIAFIQSQVFVVLSCSYIKDALELH